MKIIIDPSKKERTAEAQLNLIETKNSHFGGALRAVVGTDIE